MEHQVPTGPDEPILIAYRVSAEPAMQLVPAPAARQWMERTAASFANRCLPMLIANQAGWLLLNSHPLRVTWTGGDDVTAVEIEYLGGQPPYPAVSHFGHGLLTWTLPYLFRTPGGYNLLVRGPANLPKDGAYALEGLVETDWSPATFTMNWKLTRPGHIICFDFGEPVCMLVPQRRGELESFRPSLRDIDSDPDERRRYQGWSHDRGRFLADLRVPDSDAARQGWQRGYFQGRVTELSRSLEHQTKLKLHGFDEGASGADQSDSSGHQVG